MLGEKLKELRKLNELLQRKIAVELDVDTDYISKMDSNKKPVSRHYLQKLSVLLGIAEDEILTLWMADKLYDAAKDGAVTIKAMEVAHDELINLSKRKKK